MAHFSTIASIIHS